VCVSVYVGKECVCERECVFETERERGIVCVWLCLWSEDKNRSVIWIGSESDKKGRRETKGNFGHLNEILSGKYVLEQWFPTSER